MTTLYLDGNYPYTISKICFIMCNNYIIALATDHTLQLATTVMAVAMSIVSGISTMNVNSNPMTHSISPSNFLSKRWNA